MLLKDKQLNFFRWSVFASIKWNSRTKIFQISQFDQSHHWWMFYFKGHESRRNIKKVV